MEESAEDAFRSEANRVGLRENIGRVACHAAGLTISACSDSRMTEDFILGMICRSWNDLSELKIPGGERARCDGQRLDAAAETRNLDSQLGDAFGYAGSG